MRWVVKIVIAEQLVSKQVDYLLAVKSNQPKLHQALVNAFQKFESITKEEAPSKKHAWNTVAT